MSKRNDFTLLNWLAPFLTGIGAGVLLTKWFSSPQNSPEQKRSITPDEMENLEIKVPSEDHVDNSPTDRQVLTLQKLERENDQLKQEYQRLLVSTKESERDMQDQERTALFHALETVLVQLPVLSERIKAGADIPVDTVLSLVDLIPERLETLDIKMINAPGQITEFDLVLHKPIPVQ